MTKGPGVGNTELARQLNESAADSGEDITFTPVNIAVQRRMMKKPAAVEENNGAPAVSTDLERLAAALGSTVPAPSVPAPAPQQLDPVEVVECVLDCIEHCGGLARLKRLVDRLVQMKERAG